MYRQGDLLFLKVNSIPKTAKIVKSGVILHSDTTQHEHKLVGGVLLKTKDLQYARISKKGSILHEEHKLILLSKGLWEIRRQREYAGKDMTKIVVD